MSDQVADEHSSDGSMRHAVAGVTGGDVYVLIAGVMSDERETIDRLHHLAGPPQRNILYHREPFARPSFE